MSSQKSQRLYSCGHPKPQGPICAVITHAKPLLHSRSQLEPQRQQSQLPPHHVPADKVTSPLPQTSSHAVIFNNPFNGSSNTPPLPYNSSNATTTLASEHELTPEERVAAGMEYMRAFLASRDSGSSSATSSRSSSTGPGSEKNTSRRAAMV